MMDPKKVTVPNAVMLGMAVELLKEGHTAVIMTKGNSMLPFIRGDRDSVELTAPGALAEGQIALAQLSPGRYVLHRIISLDGGKVRLKGDGNLVGEEMCRPEDVCRRTAPTPDSSAGACAGGSCRTRSGDIRSEYTEGLNFYSK